MNATAQAPVTGLRVIGLATLFARPLSATMLGDFRLSGTPGAIRRAGRPHGADSDEILTGLGLPGSEITALRAEHVL